MSYRCQSCKEAQPARTPQTKLVVATRAVTYNNDGKISHGTEIVKEIAVCPNCAKKVV